MLENNSGHEYSSSEQKQQTDKQDLSHSAGRHFPRDEEVDEDLMQEDNAATLQD